MRLRALVIAAAVATLLAGCGGSSSSSSSPSTASTSTTSPYVPLANGELGKFPDTIVDDAIAAASSATTVHIVGSVTNHGKLLKLNLNLVTGKGGYGTVAINGLSFQIVRIDEKAYFKGDATFWSHFGGGTAGALLNGRWIEASATTGELASFTPLTDVKQLFASVLGSHGPLEKASQIVKANGKDAVAIVDSGLGTTLFVAADGPAYPLALEEKGGGIVTFDHWNASLSLVAPKNAVELDKLKP
jgi:hypothetical protein